MNIYRNIEHLENFEGCVLTIGSFDGLHTGHLEIIRRVKTLAALYDTRSLVITFHPHPRTVVYPKDKSLHLLTTLEEKINRIKTAGLDDLFVVPFTVEFSQQHPREYIEQFLMKFKPKAIVVGYDHRYGLNRSGDITQLRSYAEQMGFDVVEIEKQLCDEIVVSSSLIRKAIQAGNIEQANKLLGYPFELTGKVVHGQKIGNQLGYPTANIEIDDPLKIIPPDGIYAVKIIVDERRYDGMLYIGSRPTLSEQQNRTIEVHIFDFHSDIYEKKIKVEMHSFIREDMRLSDLSSLKSKLQDDEKNIRSFFKRVTS